MSSEESPEPIDLEALGLGSMAKRARAATFAPNWRTVLAVDAMVGFVLIVVGIGASTWNVVLGWVVIAAGVGYVFLVVRRYLQWRWLRRQAGLD